MDIENTAKNLRQVLEQVQTINNIYTALSMSIKQEDIFSIILAALISKHGLEFTRSFLFLKNTKTNCFEGKYAMGPTSKTEAVQFSEEQEEESQYLDEILSGLGEKEETQDFVPEMVDRLYSNLRSGTVWISLFQKYGLENELTEQISNIYIPAPEDKPGNKEKSFISLLLEKKHALKFDLSTQSELFPPEFQGIFDQTVAAFPITTKKGIRAILIVDRKFTNKEISYLDLKNLEWFSIHSSLAIENSELFNDLEHAYNELKEVEKLKNNFLSILSHELRTPLTSILGFVQLISKGKVGEITKPQADLLTRVSRNTMHLIKMVNDLIQLAELEAEGIMDIRLLPVDPLNVLMGVVPKLEQRKTTKKVEIEPVFTEPPEKILCDERSLEKIYYHLLDNAVKFSADGEKVLVHFSREGNYILITVEDHGIGIPKEKLQLIFNSFYQVDGGLNRTYEGLGVGLAITRILLSSTSGQIDVQSQVGTGSKFTLKYQMAK